MTDPELNPNADYEERIPIHPWTIVIGVVRKRRFLAAAALLSVILALAVALLFGGPVYQAQSVLLYRPDPDGRSNDPALTVQTQANMVLLDSNLEETRRRLDMPVSQKQLASACEVKTQPNTALIMVDVTWKSPAAAAKIANTLRDVFVQNQQSVRQSSANLEVRDLRTRIEQLRERLRSIDSKLGDFSAANGLVDLDKETQNYLAELSSTELLYDQARADSQSISMQLRKAESLLEQNRTPGSAKNQALGDLNVRYSRIRDAIHEDQNIRSNLEKMEGDKIRRDQAKQLYSEGLLPKMEYDKAEAAYQAQKALALDTDRVKAWRDEIAHLDTGLIPEDGAPFSSKETMQKLFDLQLAQVQAAERVKAFEQSLSRIRNKMAALPKLSRDLAAYAHEAESNQAELKLLEEKLGRAERAQMAKSSEFVNIADATPPAFPARSHRTIIFLGIAAFGTMLGLGVVLTRELLDGTVRSAGEAAVKLPIPLLGIVPQIQGYRPLPGPDERIPEPFRALSLYVRRTVPKRGARLLFLSARKGEGVSTVIAYLAESLRHDRLQVLVKSAQAGVAEAHAAGGLLDHTTSSYDMVLLDGPPILESIDSEVLAPLCDAAILIIAGGLTPVSAINEAIARIRSTRVPIAGAILNRVDAAYL